MTFGGIVRGNAPITKAAKTPNSKPKIILRTGELMTNRREGMSVACE